MVSPPLLPLTRTDNQENFEGKINKFSDKGRKSDVVHPGEVKLIENEYGRFNSNAVGRMRSDTDEDSRSDKLKELNLNFSRPVPMGLLTSIVLVVLVQGIQFMIARSLSQSQSFSSNVRRYVQHCRLELVLSSLSIFMMVMTYGVEPGFVLLSIRDEIFPKYLRQLNLWGSENPFLFDRLKPNLAKECDECNIPRPLRSKHCYKCKRCVYKFDHHCRMLSCCIGLKNHICFMALLCLLSSWCLVSVYDLLILPLFDVHYMMKYSGIPLTIGLHWLIILCGMLLFIGHLTMYHVSFILDIISPRVISCGSFQ
eukprot:GHVH01006369.1.p1 GENE.GHVH01006369.1~~GHVH01006369.1.p1  ORF type:complete len:311 (-),score=22.32 GHVH01006369.1:182-1114(-)